MAELSDLSNLLSRIERTVTADRNFVARALGLLLLGKEFDKDKKADDIKDPTELLLSGRVEVPEL